MFNFLYNFFSFDQENDWLNRYGFWNLICYIIMLVDIYIYVYNVAKNGFTSINAWFIKCTTDYFTHRKNLNEGNKTPCNVCYM